MSTAAHSGVYTISADDVTYVTLTSLKALGLSLDINPLDTTSFEGSQYHTYVQGLIDGGVDVEMDWSAADTGQALLRTVVLSGATFYVKALFDGTNGYKMTLKAFNLKIDAKVDGLVMQTATLKLVAALSALP